MTNVPTKTPPEPEGDIGARSPICYPHIRENSVFAFDRSQPEPLAMVDDAKCATCGEFRNCATFTDSNWEYAGTPICVSCLVRLALLMTPTGIETTGNVGIVDNDHDKSATANEPRGANR